MKASVKTAEAISGAVRALDTQEARSAYREGRFPRAELTQDLNKRYRWDLYWASQAWRLVPEQEDLQTAHIDTVLRGAVPPL